MAEDYRHKAAANAVKPPQAETGYSRFVFTDNRQARVVCGVCDENLRLLEQKLALTIHMRGNNLTLIGAAANRQIAAAALAQLQARAEAGGAPAQAETQGILAVLSAAPAALPPTALRIADRVSATGEIMPVKNLSAATAAAADEASAPARSGKAAGAAEGQNFARITTRKKVIYARTPRQNAYIKAMSQAQLVFGIGPAGTGKTYLAVAYAAALLEQGLVERIILSRPAVEAGERLGFLPGDMKEKVDPYLRPLYDALYDMMPAEKVERALQNGAIEIAPLAFMRGRTLAHSAIILDEAQNTTAMQMKMLLTRLGEGSHMVINGDSSQIDLPAGQQSGLEQAAALLSGIEDIAAVRFTEEDVVRHPLVAAIIRAYAQP